MNVDILLRKGSTADLPQLQQLFYDTVQQVNCTDYDAEQIQVWSSYAWKDDLWIERMSTQHFVLAVVDGAIAGFTSLETDGHIDLFFIHVEYQGRGIGSRLLTHLETLVQKEHGSKLYAEVSITARPFFEYQGFQVIEEETVTLQGVSFQRYRMEKFL